MRHGEAAVAPYAKALFALAKERKQGEAIGRELDSIGQLVATDAELREFFGRPWIPPAAKRAVALEIGERAGLSQLARDFLALVASHGRAHQLQAIVSAYGDLLDKDMARVRVRVRTAVPLTETEQKSLAARLTRAVDARQVVIEQVVDSHLLGGFVAEVDSLVLDASLDGQLVRMRERLAKGQG